MQELLCLVNGLSYRLAYDVVVSLSICCVVCCRVVGDPEEELPCDP